MRPHGLIGDCARKSSHELSSLVGPAYAKPEPIMDTTNQITKTGVNAPTVNRAKFTRRGFLGVGSAALAMAGIAPAMAADKSRSDPGPGNPGLDAQNPDATWPPSTDSKSLIPTFKYPFSLANKRVYEGGWSREVTVRELPVSKSMAGVNMRLFFTACPTTLVKRHDVETDLFLFDLKA